MKKIAVLCVVAAVSCGAQCFAQGGKSKPAKKPAAAAKAAPAKPVAAAVPAQEAEPAAEGSSGMMVIGGGDADIPQQLPEETPKSTARQTGDYAKRIPYHFGMLKGAFNQADKVYFVFEDDNSTIRIVQAKNLGKGNSSAAELVWTMERGAE